MPGLIQVKHNIEVAHRLYSSPGKCEAIHGHSMWVTMVLHGKINPETGMLAQAARSQSTPDVIDYEDLEFGAIKRSFRAHLDEQYDHRLLLNAADPFAGPIWQVEKVTNEMLKAVVDGRKEVDSDHLQSFLPGLAPTMGDPTTENIAKWIYNWAADNAGFPVQHVEVWETAVNSAVYFA